MYWIHFNMDSLTTFLNKYIFVTTYFYITGFLNIEKAIQSNEIECSVIIYWFGLNIDFMILDNTQAKSQWGENYQLAKDS